MDKTNEQEKPRVAQWMAAAKEILRRRAERNSALSANTGKINDPPKSNQLTSRAEVEMPSEQELMTQVKNARKRLERWMVRLLVTSCLLWFAAKLFVYHDELWMIIPIAVIVWSFVGVYFIQNNTTFGLYYFERQQCKRYGHYLNPRIGDDTERYRHAMNQNACPSPTGTKRCARCWAFVQTD
ncbi:MAG: hypothetical protein FD134_1389 [Gallionellaceae bacterium]|nr:MAG: hypothetical protein FD134_1389 [Gallionellaceae bacterium]